MTPAGPRSEAQVSTERPGRVTGRSDIEEWEAALDALEARLGSHEMALSQGVVAGPFAVVELPSTPLPDGERVRAHVALSRVRALEAQTRRMLASRPVKHSPYS